MTRRIPDLSKARILVTNDDGVNARGLDILAEIARAFSDDVWIVAPEAEQSGAGHSLTLRRPLRMTQRGERRYSVDGTPTDCVLMAVGHLLKDRKPDLALSGVNRGGNLGEDLTYSGTVAAAMEGTLTGVPSIALSQVYEDGARPDWDTACRFAPDIIRRLVEAGWPDGVLINVNFPAGGPAAVRGERVVGLGRRKIGDHLVERQDPRGVPYYWIGSLRNEEPNRPETDLAAVAEGYTAITPVHLDLTDRPTVRTLQAAFA
ncbi:MAG: 5'/3'-nucleotidase SurE [Rhodospirillaceae bacterium]|nr:5'/3'-nucleotidase SurE [Rhodospirillaceae bacterium]